MLILATLAVILSVFSLSSCKKQTRVDLLGYSRDGVEVFHENGNSIVRFYTDTDFGHDVADFEKVKIVFNLTYKNGEVIKRYKEFGYPPENARGNPELQYFDVLIEKEKISDDKPILLVRAKGVFNTEKSETAVTARLRMLDKVRQVRITYLMRYRLHISPLKT